MKKNLKYLLALCLTIALVFSLAACGQKADETPNDAQDDQQTEQEEFTPANYSIAALKGPTAMGLVKLMKDSESGETTGNEYTFTLAGSADEVTPALLKGELDMACVPANLAAVLYNKTEGEIEVLAVNTLGVLYIVENGESVHSMADLKGKTIVAAGKGSTPEYALRYLLTENGIDPDNDVTIDWKSEHSECVAALASGQASVALLPQPFVTVAQSKIEGLRMALDLNAEWDALDNGSALITGVIVARRAVVEENPAAVNEFLKEYAASVDYVNANTADAAALIGEYSIVDAAVAEKALPYCQTHKMPIVVCTTGLSEELQLKVVQLSRSVPVFKSANMSMGINVLSELCKRASAILGANYDIEIVEQHHHNKLDAPSGTALMLADAINEENDGAYHYVYDRSSVRQKRDPKEIGISAVRGGSIVGDHEVLFCGPDEVITLRHTAYSRNIFANGATNAAVYLAKKEPGLYNMSNMIAEM